MPEERVISASDILTKIEAGEPAEFDNSIIVGDLNLSGLKIERPVHFNHTIFQDSVNFKSTIFNGDAYFLASEFNSNAYFWYSEFNGNAYFWYSEFNGNADFKFSVFNGDAYWYSVFNSNAYFWYSVFNGDAYFGYSEFNSDADFGYSVFNSNANFGYSVFNSDAYFMASEFNSDAYFMASEFNSNAYFGYSVFNSTADFRFSEFNSDVYFGYSEFNGDVYFGYSEFNGDAYFVDSVFNGNADFVGSMFNTTDFSAARFNKAAYFNDAQFKRTTSFNNSRFKEDALFENATFKDVLYLTRTKYDKIYIKWYSINKGLGYEESAYQQLIENFKKLGYSSDVDNSYYQFRRDQFLHREPTNDILIYISDLAAWLFYGFGKRPLFALIWSAFFVLVFGGIWMAIGSMKSISKIDEYSQIKKWPDSAFEALLFSATLFLSGTKLFVDPPAIPELQGVSRSMIIKVFIAERLLGALFSILFFLAVTGMIIKST